MNRPLPLAILLVLLAGAVAVAPPAALAQENDTLHTVSGVVRDDAGAPLAGVHVSGNSYTYRPDGSGSATATTDEEGRYSLRLPEGTAYVSASHPKWNRGNGQELEVRENATLDLVIPRPPPKDAVVTGRVLDQDGNPVSGARVTIGQGCCYAMPMPVEEPSEPAEPEREPATDDGASNGTSAASGNATAPSPPESGGASGGSSGEGAASDAIAPRSSMPFHCCSDYDYQETTTGDDGVFRFETYPGPRQVTVLASGFAQSSITVQAQANETVTEDVRLEKVPDATATLRGRVVDAETGLPVANAYVSLANLEWSRWNNTQTSADGAFSFQTIPGWVQLTVNAEHGARPMLLEVVEDGKRPPVATGPAYRHHVQAFMLPDGTTTRDVQLVPKPLPEVVLTGYVVDPTTQKAVPGAWVNLHNQDTGDWGDARTDADGSYRMLVRPGYHTITAYADGHLQGTSTLVVEEGQTLVRYDVETPKGQTKYAPCDECYVEHREIAYAEGGAGKWTSEDASATPAPAGEPATARLQSGGSSFAPAASTSGTQSYSGGAGGLGPYTPGQSATSTGTETVPAAKTNTVPGPGVVAALGIAALAAVTLRRRR